MVGVIKTPSGKVVSYAEYEDMVKTVWKERMRKEFFDEG